MAQKMATLKHVQIHVILGLRNSKKQYTTETPKDLSSLEEGSVALIPSEEGSCRAPSWKILEASSWEEEQLLHFLNSCHSRPQELQKGKIQTPKDMSSSEEGSACCTDSYKRKDLQKPYLKDPGSIFRKERRSVAIHEVERSPINIVLRRKDFRENHIGIFFRKKNALTFICKKGYSIFRRKKVTWNTFKGPPMYFLEKGKHSCSISLYNVFLEFCQYP